MESLSNNGVLRVHSDDVRMTPGLVHCGGGGSAVIDGFASYVHLLLLICLTRYVQ